MRAFLGVGRTGEARRRQAVVAVDCLAVITLLMYGATRDVVYNLGGDRWLGPDKLFHAAMTVALAAFVFAASGVFTTRRTLQVCAAIGVAVVAGVGKEAMDLVGYGTASIKDITWDVIGTVVAPLLFPYLSGAGPDPVQDAATGSAAGAGAGSFASSARNKTTAIAA